MKLYIKQSLSMLLNIGLIGTDLNSLVGNNSPVRYVSTGLMGQIPRQSIVEFKLPPKGAPGRRRGKPLERRGGCKATSKKRLTALIPPTNLGRTVSPRPSFWISVPYKLSSPREVMFKLVDKQASQEIYKVRVAVSGDPGILSIILPESASPLSIDKRYQWIFSLLCNPQDA